MFMRLSVVRNSLCSRVDSRTLRGLLLVKAGPGFSPWSLVVGLFLVPAIASAQTPTPTEPTAPVAGEAESPATGAEATPEATVAPVSTPTPATAPPEVPAAPAASAETPKEAPAATVRGDDVDGPGTHVAMMDAWFGLVASQADVNRVDSKGLGAALGVRVCLICLLLADSKITGGDLLGLDTGFGFQSPENKSIGNAWALLRVDLGLQVAVRPVKDLEVILRYFVISHWNSVRDVGSSDDIYVLEPGVRYRQFLVDVGFAAKPFAYPLLAEHGKTGSLLSLRGRYLLDMKKGYFAGVAYERIGAPSAAVTDYSSNVFRFMLGQQL